MLSHLGLNASPRAGAGGEGDGVVTFVTADEKAAAAGNIGGSSGAKQQPPQTAAATAEPCAPERQPKSSSASEHQATVSAGSQVTAATAGAQDASDATGGGDSKKAAPALGPRSWAARAAAAHAAASVTAPKLSVRARILTVANLTNSLLLLLLRLRLRPLAAAVPVVSVAVLLAGCLALGVASCWLDTTNLDTATTSQHQTTAPHLRRAIPPQDRHPWPAQAAAVAVAVQDQRRGANTEEGRRWMSARWALLWTGGCVFIMRINSVRLVRDSRPLG